MCSESLQQAARHNRESNGNDTPSAIKLGVLEFMKKISIMDDAPIQTFNDLVRIPQLESLTTEGYFFDDNAPNETWLATYVPR